MNTNIRRLYGRLGRIRDSLRAQPGASRRVDGLFKTYIGDSYRGSPRRLMVVGQAAVAWRPSRRAKLFLMGDVAAGDRRSRFWEFTIKLSRVLNRVDAAGGTGGTGGATAGGIKGATAGSTGGTGSAGSTRRGSIGIMAGGTGSMGNIGSAVVGGTVSQRQEALGRIAWSNLMKIGIDGDKPRGDAHKLQSATCVELLREEIGYWQPTHLVFITENDYWGEVVNVLGSREQRLVCPGTWQLDNVFPNCQAFCVRHPQCWDARAKAIAIRHICGGAGQ